MFDDEQVEVEEQQEEDEPQINSADPNERKLARRLRIERRLEAIRKQNLPEGDVEEEICEKPILTAQLQKSAKLLETLLLQGEETVTNVRIASDVREVDRREDEGISKEKILDELEEEAQLASEMFNNISEKWASIFNYKDPLNMQDAINSQKEQCNQVFAQKDGVIAMLKEEIKKAEIKFARDQRRQNYDIETLSKRIEQQIILMRRAYRNEYTLIEDALLTERKNLIEAGDKKFNELHKKRDENEDTLAEEKSQMLDDFWTNLTKVRVDHQEKYRETKIKLETDIQNLQQEFEHIKAMTLTNGEKLDYNYQLLKKREDENIIIKSQQKRRITKLQDQINNLRKKIKDYDESSNIEIEKLTSEVYKLQKCVLDTEDSADSYSKKNDLQYQQLWEMNQKKADDLLYQILSMDRIIHEQQLGVPYEESEVLILDKEELPSYKSAVFFLQNSLKKDKSTTEDKKSVGNIFESTKKDEIIKANLLSHILKQIGDKSGFLVETKLKEILKEFTEKEQTLVRIDCVFDALSVTKPEQIETLIEHFLPYSYCNICETQQLIPSENTSESEIDLQSCGGDVIISTSSTESVGTLSICAPNIMATIHPPLNIIEDIVSSVLDAGHKSLMKPTPQLETKESFSPAPSDEHLEFTIDRQSRGVSVDDRMECWRNHTLLIRPIYVLKALKGFVSKCYIPIQPLQTMTERLSHQRRTLSRLLESRDVEMFWSRYKEKFSTEKEELWDGLMWGLKKYHEILIERKKVNDDIVKLKNENEELKSLVLRYEKAKKKALAPPCAREREKKC